MRESFCASSIVHFESEGEFEQWRTPTSTTLFWARAANHIVCINGNLTYIYDRNKGEYLPFRFEGQQKTIYVTSDGYCSETKDGDKFSIKNLINASYTKDLIYDYKYVYVDGTRQIPLSVLFDDVAAEMQMIGVTDDASHYIHGTFSYHNEAIKFEFIDKNAIFGFDTAKQTVSAYVESEISNIESEISNIENEISNVESELKSYIEETILGGAW